MSAQVKYRIASGEPTRKWKASAGTGVGVGLPLGIVVAYVVAAAFPTMPDEVKTAVVAVIMWSITQGAMMIAGWRTRPSPDDAPVVDPATVPPVGIPPA